MGVKTMVLMSCRKGHQFQLSPDMLRHGNKKNFYTVACPQCSASNIVSRSVLDQMDLPRDESKPVKGKRKMKEIDVSDSGMTKTVITGFDALDQKYQQKQVAKTPVFEKSQIINSTQVIADNLVKKYTTEYGLKMSDITEDGVGLWYLYIDYIITSIHTKSQAAQVAKSMKEAGLFTLESVAKQIGERLPDDLKQESLIIGKKNWRASLIPN